ncbi:hypothetical protein BU26DRAFT_525108 [Trematosphaeria pertusa]|uniref:FAR1 domain-containing protein n=1 Tax=Trematosphaeria pertusa TaxID=390896 RepID=A0A6A6HV25_9PLEO|nr:uncharacterized protein BU26DRAFT_525108 [Trematosphaeria pertusa]KAF2241612.1 hypothetical protein BU26DRAFT_525108 [Trematosphaeria pertusa]
MIRPALHSHIIEQDGPIYGPLPTDIEASAPAYPAFAPSVDPANDHAISRYGVPSPGEHQAPHTQHEHLEHNGLHFDPNLSSEGPAIGRPSLPNSSPVQQQNDFPPSTPPRAQSAPIPPIPPIIANSAPPGHFDMLPPPASTHPSWQALHEYAQSHASEHGYALSINTTAKNRSRIKLACVCYGAPKNTHKLTPETRVRKNRVSYKTGCKMWIEGKKQDDGLWALRVGEPMHNHPGRAVEGWAVQRKRTWGVQGGRVGVGGVTAKEEKERLTSIDNGQPSNQEEAALEEKADSPVQPRKASHSLESGGLVWKIVEQEMLRKGGPGQGRDRGVGRTVKILEERLPGIHIFKRDVYNIRAQIKRARKAAGEQLGEGLDDSDNEGEEETQDQDGQPNSNQQRPPGQDENHEGDGNDRNYSQIDPTLIAQCNSALNNMPRQEESEVDRLKREVAELRKALAQRTKEVEEKNSENESLRVQVELANMALYNERGDSALDDRMRA